ncbi:MAG: alpha/beta hydrolase [Planctomycetes bacterium]|nr:alpha/beta hydrolase [Planctomycetota bacterium]
MDWFRTWPEGAPTGLDPKVRAALLAAPAGDFRSQGAAEVRANFNALAAKIPKPEEPLESVGNGPTLGGLRLRLYRPKGEGPFPICLYFHGGGWVVGDLESHDHVCRSLARRGNTVVVNVDYRLAPETKFPGALDDCLAALRWTQAHAADLEGDAARISVAGDSAGAHLAAGLALRVRDEGGPRISSQLLIYPVTDRDFDTSSYREFATGYGLTRANMQWFWDCYLRDEADASNPWNVPLRAKELRGLPPAWVLTAEYDVLRDEGEAYAKRLHEAGVPVRCVRFLGLNHGFIRMAAVYPQADLALTLLADALKRA